MYVRSSFIHQEIIVNAILNRYYKSEIKHFKFYYYVK
jgi:hypothetical protein